MRGVTVEFRWPVAAAVTTGGESVDSLGNEVVTWGDPVEVADVLVEPIAARDSKESDRPHGIESGWRLVIPRSFAASLRGSEARVPGDPEWYAVVGDPKAAPDGQLRRAQSRNRIAEAVRRDG